MATRDLMSAIESLSELYILDDEHDDIELAYAKLGRIVKRNSLRRLRSRSYGYTQTVLHPMAVHQVPQAPRPQPHRTERMD